MKLGKPLQTFGALLALNVLVGLLCAHLLLLTPAWERFELLWAKGWDVVAGPEAPAWIQAVGSIVAILAAWWGIQHQLKAARAERKRAGLERDIANLEAVKVVGSDAEKALRFFHTTSEERLEAGKSFRFAPERLEELQQTIRVLLARDMPATGLAQLINIQRLVANTRGAMREYNAKGVAISAASREVVGKRVQTIQNVNQQLSKALTRLRANAESDNKASWLGLAALAVRRRMVAAPTLTDQESHSSVASSSV